MSFWVALTLTSANHAAESAPTPPEQAAREQLTLLALGVTAYQRDMGRFPTRAEGLAALVQRPTGADAEHWQGPYLEQPPGLLPDPWGRPYVYDVRPAEPDRPFSIYSCGPDGISASGGNDPDDVHFWPDTAPGGPEPPAVAPLETQGLRRLRAPLGWVVVLTVVVALLRWYSSRAAVLPAAHPGGYVRRHQRRRHRPETPAPPQGS